MKTNKKKGKEIQSTEPPERHTDQLRDRGQKLTSLPKKVLSTCDGWTRCQRSC